MIPGGKAGAWVSAILSRPGSCSPSSCSSTWCPRARRRRPTGSSPAVGRRSRSSWGGGSTGTPAAGAAERRPLPRTTCKDSRTPMAATASTTARPSSSPSAATRSSSPARSAPSRSSCSTSTAPCAASPAGRGRLARRADARQRPPGRQPPHPERHGGEDGPADADGRLRRREPGPDRLHGRTDPGQPHAQAQARRARGDRGHPDRGRPARPRLRRPLQAGRSLLLRGRGER